MRKLENFNLSDSANIAS